MMKIALILASLAMAWFAYAWLGPVYAAGLLGGLAFVYLMVVNAGPGGLAVIKGLAVTGMVFGSVWTVIGFAAGGLLVGGPALLAVFVCYALNKDCKSRLSAYA